MKVTCANTKHFKVLLSYKKVPFNKTVYKCNQFKKSYLLPRLENFLEALGERFGWILVPLPERSEFGTFIQISEPSASKKLKRNPGR